MQNIVNTTTEMRSELDHTARRLAGPEERLRIKDAEDAARRQQPQAPGQRATQPPRGRCRAKSDDPRQSTTNARRRRRPDRRSPQAPGVGNLGWDTPAQDLQQRLDAALEKAMIDSTTITATHCVVGRDGRGSAAEVHFASEHALQAAKAKMRNAHQSVIPGKTIWLDVKKTREELAPARAIHRAYEILTDPKGRREDSAMLDKNVGSKVIFCSERGTRSTAS